MTHDEIKKQAEEYAKKWLMLPPEYQRYAVETFLAGYDFHTKVILDNMPKCEDFDCGTVEYAVYHHIQAHVAGLEPMKELVCKLRRMFSDRDSDDDDRLKKSMSIKEEPKLPWKQLSLFD